MKIFLTLFMLAFIAAPAADCFAAGHKRYAPGRLIVKYRDNPAVSAVKKGPRRAGGGLEKMAKRYGLKGEQPLAPARETRKSFTAARAQSHPLDCINVLSFDSTAGDMEAIAREYMLDPDVEYAQPDYFLEVAAIPNDTLYPQQWAHPKMNSPAGWDITAGAGAVIAVVDTGVDWNHPDLAANIWTNTGEVAGNGIDDDLNGYVDDVRGWDFVDFYYPPLAAGFAAGEDYDTEDSDPMDFYGHGTIVAGVAAAVGDNAAGVCGTSYASRIMPLRVGIAEASSGNAYVLTSWCASAVRYAADNDADVVNLSLVDPTWSESGASALKSAVDYAYSHNCVVVAAGGNNGEGYPPAYPAAYSLVIGVAATDPSDQRAIWGEPDPYPHESDYGTWLKVAAPGS